MGCCVCDGAHRKRNGQGKMSCKIVEGRKAQLWRALRGVKGGRAAGKEKENGVDEKRQVLQGVVFLLLLRLHRKFADACPRCFFGPPCPSTKQFLAG